MSIDDLPPIDVLDEEPEFDLILMWPWEGEDDARCDCTSRYCGVRMFFCVACLPS